jgi:tetratricopeptide (TPR) repeat protein
MHLAEAQALEKLGRPDEADAACAEALRLTPQKYRALTESRCSCMMPLRRNQVEQAIPGCERALAVTGQLYGTENSNYSNILDIVAHAYLQADRFAEAKALRDQFLALTARLEGEDSLEYAMGLYNDAELQDSMAEGQGATGARDTLVRALAIIDALKPPPRWNRGLVLAALARHEADLGDCVAAVPRTDEAMAIFEATFAPNSPALADEYAKHGTLLADCGGHGAEALAALDKAIAIYEAHAPGSANYGVALTHLTELLVDQKKIEAAVAAGERAVAALAHGKAPYNLARAYEELGEALLRRGPAGRTRARDALTRARDGFVALERSKDAARVETRLRQVR